ncbi:MAG: hypothetical protein UR28_C0042G0003 [Candidatus Peregrinibacteria bacterium GW2011_GWF2_33_10]|nr:MAG: hypothetical protein UR28_C0042G0003 [Candidatus Peregrinibacteria bacterium GW2011_GWF2_33_10]
MKLKDNFKIIGKNIKKEIKIYQVIIKDTKTPLLGKVCVVFSI